MDYIEFMWWKLIGMAVLAFLWGLFCGWNGLELNGRQKQQAPNARAKSETQD